MSNPAHGVVYDSAADESPAREELSDVLGNGALIAALLTRNLKVRYRRSALGVLWSLAQPAAILVAVTLVFAPAFTSGAAAYALQIAPGLLLWQFFAQTSLAIVSEVAHGAVLWRRVRMPKTATAIATIGAGAVNLALGTLPVLAALPFVGVAPRPLLLLTLPLTVVAAACFALGVGLALSAAAVYFTDTSDAYQLILLPWMFITPVIYPRTILSGRAALLVSYNPMSWLVEAFRAPFIGHAVPLASFVLIFASSSAMLLFGWILFAHHAHEISYRR